jgi:hypothetical protein
MIKTIENYGVSTAEVVEIFDSLGHVIAAIAAIAVLL